MLSRPLKLFPVKVGRVHFSLVILMHEVTGRRTSIRTCGFLTAAAAVCECVRGVSAGACMCVVKGAVSVLCCSRLLLVLMVWLACQVQANRRYMA